MERARRRLSRVAVGNWNTRREQSNHKPARSGCRVVGATVRVAAPGHEHYASAATSGGARAVTSSVSLLAEPHP